MREREKEKFFNREKEKKTAEVLVEREAYSLTLDFMRDKEFIYSLNYIQLYSILKVISNHIIFNE